MKLLLLKALSRYPRKLPVGLSEFDAFVERVLSQSGRFADDTSLKFALASILIHADSKFGSLPDKYFIDRLVKSAANQVASQVFQDIKIQQDAARQAAQQPAEVTAPAPEALTSNVEKS